MTRDRLRGALRLNLLGGFETRLATGPAVTLPTRKAQALLAYLAVRPGHAHPRDKLAALLWGDRGESQARDSLRHTLVELRKVLPARLPSLIVEGRAVSLDPAAVDVDVVRFALLVDAGTAEGLAQAAEVYQGDLLEGFVLREPAFEEWLVAERERLRERALDALRRLLEHQHSARAVEPAIRTAQRLLALDATQEVAHRALMRLYVQQGRRAAALRQYQTCMGVVQRELGTEPEAETRQLYQEIIRRRDEAPSRRTTTGKASPEPMRLMPPPPRPDAVTSETSLIGRDIELAALRNALAEAGWGRGRAVAILGEAGVGKSRLLAEVAADARARNSRVLLGRAYESAQILPFGPWVDAFRTGGLIAADPALTGLHPVWRAELARLFPEVAEPGLPPASEDYLRLFESVAALIAHILAATQPLLLMLEDLHWADEMSLRLLSFLGRRVHVWPALVVATAREEELADADALRRALGELRGDGHFTELVLSPLSRPDTSRLVRSLTAVGSEEGVAARLDEQVWAASEGNPFVIVETVRALRDGMTLDEPTGLSLPRRVRDVIAGRVERLSERSRDLLSLAAVIGREFDFALLQRASGLTDRDAAAGVEELVRRRMLHGADEGFDFTHDRIRETVYGGLLPPRRKLLHGDVAVALEALTAGALDPPAAALGMHYRHAEIWDKAVVYLRQAGLRAAGRSAPQEARSSFELALDILGALPESRGTVEQAFDIRLELRPVLYELGDVRAVLERVREAEVLAETLNDDLRRGRVWAVSTHGHLMRGELDEARACGARALAIARRLGDLELRQLSTTFLGQVHHYRGEYEQQAALIADNIAAQPAHRVYKSLGFGVPIPIFDRVQMVVSLSQLGRFAEAAAYEGEAMRLAEPTHHPYTIGLAHLVAVMLRLLKGDWASARSLAEQWVTVLRGGNVVAMRSTALASSAWALARLGDASTALDRLREGHELLERQQTMTLGLRGWAYQALGRASLLLGRLDEAHGLAARAVDSSPLQSGYAAHALLLLGDVATHPDRFDAEQGEAHYGKALALGELRGMRPLIAHCHLGLSRTAGLTSRDRAREHLRIALTLYREMDMGFWLEEASGAVRQER